MKDEGFGELRAVVCITVRITAGMAHLAILNAYKVEEASPAVIIVTR